MQFMIQNMLDMMKISRGTLRPEQDLFDIEKSCTEMLDLLKIQMKTKKLKYLLIHNNNIPNWVISDKYKYQ
jgi:K+-sensing histidine kinase KdpD